MNAMIGTLKIMMDAILHVLLKLDGIALEAQTQLEITVLKFVEI